MRPSSRVWPWATRSGCSAATASLNEALNGLRGGVALGVVPAGGANVLARSLGARERRISVGRVNGRRFRVLCGHRRRLRRRARAGDAGSARERPPLQRPPVRPGSGCATSYGATSHGSRSWAWAARRRLRLERRGLHVRRPPAAALPTCCSLRAWSGRRGARSVTALSSACLAPACSSGAGWPVHGVLAGHDLDRIEVHCDVPLPLQADGEDLGDVREAVFEAERDAVTVLQ